MNSDKAPVAYTIDLADMGQDHLLEVQARYSHDGSSKLELFLPVWTPGSYLIREYARQIESIYLVEGADNGLSITKTRKNAWLVEGLEGYEEISIRYRLYAREKSVRTNWVESGLAFIVGARLLFPLIGFDMQSIKCL